MAEPSQWELFCWAKLDMPCEGILRCMAWLVNAPKMLVFQPSAEKSQ